MEIYTVSWATIDKSEVENSDSGMFSNIFLTRKAAREAVMDDIKELAKDDLDMYDTKEDRIDALGAATPAALAKKMAQRDYGLFIEVINDCDIVTQYVITKYDTDYAVG